MRFLPSRLRSRLLLLVAAAYIPAAVYTVWTIQRDREEALAAVGARIQSVLHEASTDNDAAVAAGRRLVEAWTAIPELATGSRATCEETLVRLLRSAPFVASPTRISKDGIVDCGGRTAASIGVNVGANPLFLRVMREGAITLGPYLVADSTRPALLPVNVPLRDATGRATGVLSVGLKLDWLDRIARNADLPGGTIVTVADSTGRLIARLPYARTVGTERPKLDSIMEADRLRGTAQEGLTVRRASDGVIRLIAHRQLQSAEGTFVRLAIATPPEVAYAAPNARARTRVALLLLAAAVALIIAWYCADVLVLRDVKAILTATRRLGAGDLGARTGIARHDGEIEQLADSFDTMASRLEERQERVRHAERLESLGRLAGGVAHDFNNMLTAIVGSADMALEELPDDHVARSDLLTIKAAATRSNSLTRQLLDFSRRTPLLSAPVRLDQLVEQSAALLVRLVPATVSVHVHTQSERLVRADAGRIEQALINLAVNARDAMPNGGVLTISLDNVDVLRDDALSVHMHVGHWVRLRVSDTGSGIPSDVLSRVFEPFFTTKTVGDGTGLGLAMVYGTVQHHGGHIHIDSAVGKGTTVTIWIPEAPGEPHGDDELTPALRASVRGARVLIAEDQPEVQRLVTRLLTRAGVEVHVASDGLLAIEAGRAMGASLDALITDFDMPGCRGDEVARALRITNPELPLVLMSGYASDGWPDDLTGTDRSVLIEKPFSTDALLTALADVLTPPARS